MLRSKARILLIFLLSISISLSGLAPSLASVDNFFIDEDRIRTYAGDLSGAIQEKYLFAESGSHAEIEAPVGGWGGAPPYLTKRWADGNGWFTYRLPIDAATPAPLYLSMVTKGEIKMTVSGQVLLDTGNSGQGDYTAREFKLDDPQFWANGYVEVKFEDADPSDGWGPNLYWLELGGVSAWQKRLQHIHWDTTDIVWYVGYPDGYASEFQGNVTDFTVGSDISTLQRDGTIKLRWDQHIDPSKTYYFLAGVIGRHPGIFNKANGYDYIDVGDNGINDIAELTGGQKIYEIDITSQLQSTGNVVKVSVPSGARYDFFAVIEVSPTPVIDMDALRLSFGGNEQAVNFSKIINYSMLHTLDFMNYENSGLIDASPVNGMFWNSYWVADIGPGVTELFKWGYLDRTHEVLSYSQADPSGHYEDDIAAGNLIFNTMANVMRAENLSVSTVNTYWNRLKNGMNRLMQYVDSNSYDLVYGTNWETSSNSWSLYASSTSYVALMNAADIAGKLGFTTEQSQWLTYADRIYDGINQHLTWTHDASYSGHAMKKSTWKYGIMGDGSNPSDPHAGWHAIGSAKDGYWGLKEDLSHWRHVSDYTLNYHRDTFWPNWQVYGNNKGFGTDYGVLSERGGWALNSLIEADRMAETKKNIEHIVFNSTDLNFAPYGPNPSNHWDNAGNYLEYSPWDIIRETDPYDYGSSSDVGNGFGNEDLNLVEYILFLKNARLLAGVDDALYGDNNLVIIPRLPWGWDRVNVNRWPVSYKDGADYARTTLTFSMDVEPTKATMNVSAAADISDVQIRLGPFDPTATVASVSVDGLNVPYTEEVKGDASWVWVTHDISTSNKQIEVNMDIPRLVATYDFGSNSLDDYTSHGGTWSATNQQANVSTTNDAWLVANDPVDNHMISADVKLNSGNAVGVSLRTDGSGSQGYDLIIDRWDGLIKLAKRPYTVLAAVPMNVNLERTYNLELHAHGSQLEGYLNGVKVLEAWDDTYDAGQHALFAFASQGHFDNVSVKSIDHDDFNGPLNAVWSTDIPLAGPTVAIDNDQLHVSVPNTNIYDQWVGFDDTPKLIRTDLGTENFIIETKLDLVNYAANTNFHTGLFVKFAADDYYLWGNLQGRALELARSGIPALGYVDNFTDPTVYLRLRKSGKAYYVDYKVNPEDPWINVASDFNEAEPLAVGVMTKTWEPLNHEVAFDYFTLKQ